MPKGQPQLSNVIVLGLHPLFAKETNETALTSLVDAIMAHQTVLLKDDSAVDDKTQKLIVSGVADKRAKVRSAWAVAISQLIWTFDDPDNVNESVIRFSKSLGKQLCAVFHEIASNALQAAQNGFIASGYAISAITLGRWLEWKTAELSEIVKAKGILNITISVAPKPSFLLNDRIYTKLSNSRDQTWAVNALEASARRAITEMETAWPLAAIFFVANPKIPKEVRFSLINMVKRVLNLMETEGRCQAADYIIFGVEEWLRQLSEERKEGPAAAVGEGSLTRLKDIISAMLSAELVSDTSYAHHVLRRLLVLCHHPRLSRKQWSWIEVSRHANVDPGHLTEGETFDCIEPIQEKMWPKEKVCCLRFATNV